MQQKPTLLVLAAGMGSRFGGVKQISKLGPHGETIIDYSVYDALQAGFGKVVFVIRRSIEEDFKEVILNKYKGKADVDYVLQELDALPQGFRCPEGRTKPWGTAHAILMAKEKVDSFFAVINGDDYYGRHAFQTMADYLRSLSLEKDGDKYSMVAYRLENTLSDHGSVSRGICQMDAQGLLTGVKEHTHIERKEGKIVHTNDDASTVLLSPDDLTSMNFWGFHPSLFAHLERMFTEFLQANLQNLKAECYIPQVVDTLIKAGEARVKVLKTDAEWFGITYQEDSQGVSEAFRRLHAAGVYPERLW
ncbi:MAG: NTP transferase domain-containing protein [Bacteroidales bacterium]|nr:NTP transferase domain-containing protein [Bacteroidales bacterium]